MRVCVCLTFCDVVYCQPLRERLCETKAKTRRDIYLVRIHWALSTVTLQRLVYTVVQHIAVAAVLRRQLINENVLASGCKCHV